MSRRRRNRTTAPVISLDGATVGGDIRTGDIAHGSLTIVKGRQVPAAPQLEEQPVAAAAAKVLEIAIDTSRLMVPDLKFLARARRGEIRDEEAVDFLERVVVGGVASVPFDALGQVWAAVYQAVYGGKRAKN